MLFWGYNLAFRKETYQTAAAEVTCCFWDAAGQLHLLPLPCDLCHSEEILLWLHIQALVQTNWFLNPMIK